MHARLALARGAAGHLHVGALDEEQVAEEREDELEEHILLARALRRIFVSQRRLEEQHEHRDRVLLQKVPDVRAQVGFVRWTRALVKLVAERHRHRDQELDHCELETLVPARRAARDERKQAHRQHAQLRQAQVDRPRRRVAPQVALDIPHALEAVLPLREPALALARLLRPPQPADRLQLVVLVRIHHRGDGASTQPRPSFESNSVRPWILRFESVVRAI